MKAIVVLPPGEDLNDWIAVHVVDFFNRINLIYGTVSDFCTKEVKFMFSATVHIQQQVNDYGTFLIFLKVFFNFYKVENNKCIVMVINFLLAAKSLLKGRKFFVRTYDRFIGYVMTYIV